MLKLAMSLALLLAGASCQAQVVSNLVVNPDGTATMRVTLTAEELLRARASWEIRNRSTEAPDQTPSQWLGVHSSGSWPLPGTTPGSSSVSDDLLRLSRWCSTRCSPWPSPEATPDP